MKRKVIPNHNNVPVMDVFLLTLRTYLSENHFVNTITLEKQKDILDRLQGNIDRGKFSFIMDGLNETIKYRMGVRKWLGYTDDDFTIKKFVEMTHPSHLVSHWMFGSTIWHMLEKYKNFVNFYNITAVYTCGIKHSNGNYLYCSCECFCFQISKENKALEYGYEYTILKHLDKEHFNVSFFDNNGIRPDILEIYQKIKKEKFQSIKLFSEQEMRILYRYAERNNTTIASLSLSFKIDETTVAKHNNNILNKARMFFHNEFGNTKQFALYLKTIELI